MDKRVKKGPENVLKLKPTGPPLINSQALVATLKTLIADPEVEVVRRTEGQKRPAAPASSIHSEMFAVLERAQKKVFPEAITVPLMATGATDGAQLRAKGVQVYGVSIPVDDEDLKRMHGNDERISIEALGRFTDYLYDATTEIAAKK